MGEETRGAGITGTMTVVVTEDVGGEETGVGEEMIVDSNTGTTETEIETETGTGVMEVGLIQGGQAPTRDTTLIIRDHIMIATDLYSDLSGVTSIYSIHSPLVHIVVPHMALSDSRCYT